MRVLVLGFDGADWELISNWANKGKLPNFKKLMELGVFGPLKSTIPPITPPAWTSMSTGKKPEKHGIIGFIKMEWNNGWNKSMYNSRDKKSLELWDYIPESVVVNVPITYPPRKIDGIMVTGMLTPSKDSDFTYPPEFKKEILENIPNYIIELDWSKYQNRKREFIRELYIMTENRIKLFWYIFNNKRWKLLFFVFVGPDRIQHILWGSKDLEEYWIYLDSFIGEVISKIEDENICLLAVSDHGFCHVDRVVNISNILLKLNLLKFQSKDAESHNTLISTLLRCCINIYKKIPTKIQNLIRPIANIIYTNPKIDLRNSIAICVSEGSFGSIYLSPLLPSKKRKETISLIEKALRNIVDKKTLEPVLNIYKANQKENQNKLYPDLIVLPSEGYSIGEYSPLGVITTTSFKNGDHRLNGIFLAYGPGIKKGYRIEDAKIYDVAPTILHIFGLPIPNDMDGKVLVEIFEPNSEFAKREPKYVDPSYYDRISERQKIRAKLGKIKTVKKL